MNTIYDHLHNFACQRAQTKETFQLFHLFGEIRRCFLSRAYAVYVDNDKLAFHKSIFHLSVSAFFSSLWVFAHPFTWS